MPAERSDHRVLKLRSPSALTDSILSDVFPPNLAPDGRGAARFRVVASSASNYSLVNPLSCHFVTLLFLKGWSALIRLRGFSKTKNLIFSGNSPGGSFLPLGPTSFAGADWEPHRPSALLVPTGAYVHSFFGFRIRAKSMTPRLEQLIQPWPRMAAERFDLGS